MRIGSLFSGIGGLELGLEWAGVGSVAWQVECDPFCRRVLARHWPDAERFEDVREVGAHNLAPVDVIAGGFPCQDLSLAGKGAGLHGERSGLFWELARIVRELRPRFVVLENVAAILGRGAGDVLGTLAALGYDAEWSCVRASDVGAMHRRDRWFCVAWLPPGMADRDGAERAQQRHEPVSGAAARSRVDRSGPPVADRNGGRREGVGLEEHPGQQGARGDEPNGRSTRRRGQGAGGGTDAARAPFESLVGRGSHGISLRLDVAPPGADQYPWEAPRLVENAPDRTARLRALGNAVVPQVAALVGRRLLEIAEREGLR